MITNKTYDVLKYITQIALPALLAAYAAIAGIWGFPSTDQIVGTGTALITLLSSLLGLSSAVYERRRRP